MSRLGAMDARGEISRATRCSRRGKLTRRQGEGDRHVAAKNVDCVAVGDFSSRTGLYQNEQRGQALVEMTKGQAEQSSVHELMNP
jgi:hypothetical protein